jgi:DNA-binding XRE family transcriptional regulator
MQRIIHNRIALFRADNGLSRKDLADKVGVNPQTIGFLERGDYKPSLELAMKLSDQFGVSIDMLFSFHPFPSVAETLRQAGD